jgi:hypothetical protein
LRFAEDRGTEAPNLFMQIFAESSRNILNNRELSLFMHDLFEDRFDVGIEGHFLIRRIQD